METGFPRHTFLMLGVTFSFDQVKTARPAAAPFYDNRQQLIAFELRIRESASMTEDEFDYPSDD